jgi:hypothetical protein
VRNVLTVQKLARQAISHVAFAQSTNNPNITAAVSNYHPMEPNVTAIPPVPEEWVCGSCLQLTSIRHFLQRDGVIVHDPDAAYREVVGLDPPEPMNPDANGSNDG